MSSTNVLIGVVFMQAFYAFAITLLIHSYPASMTVYTSDFSSIASNISINDIVDDVDSNLRSQTSIPIVEVGAMLIYSGNFFIDLFVNFVTAIPQMIVLIIDGITQIFAIDVYLTAQFKLFMQSILFVIYVLGLIQTVLLLRSGQRVI